MKLFAKVAAPLLALLVAAGAAVAMAAPIPPKEPYPVVKIDPKICKLQALAVKKFQIRHNYATKRYQRAKDNYDLSAGSLDEFKKAEKDLQKIDIELNKAKYAEALCQQRKGGVKPKQSCEEMSLELNRLIDELPMRKRLEEIAKDDHQKAKTAREKGGAVSAEQVETLEEEALVAEIERQEVEQAIQDQRDLIAADPACKDFPSERPEVLPPPREVPPGEGGLPTSTPSVPTATVTPQPTVTSSRVDTSVPMP